MLTIKNTIQNPWPALSILDGVQESLCFFDIETTGLSADTSMIYLIGCMHIQQDTLTLTQWFADDYESEEAMLDAFFSHITNFSCLVHFNGKTFDIPYLKKKCRMHHKEASFPPSLQMLDLYQRLRPYRSLLGISHMRQKNLEQYIGIDREDPFSGGELISVYSEYMQKKLLGKPEADRLKETLLLHNREDILYMLPLCTLLAFPLLLPQAGKKGLTSRSLLPSGILSDTPHKDFLHIDNATIDMAASDKENGIVKGEEEPMPPVLMLRIDFSLPFAFPVKHTWPVGNFTLSIHDKTASLCVMAEKSCMYYFYPDYKNYYYLPKEDTAIHKDIASYVDSAYRKKASAATCYTKKEGIFVPCFSYTGSECFYHGYKQKPAYVEVNDTFLHTNSLLASYVSDIMQHFSGLL